MKRITIIGTVILTIGLGLTFVPLYVVPTHLEIADTIPTILRNDGKTEYADILESNLNSFKKGLSQSDEFLNAREHYFNPDTKKGLANFKDGGTVASDRFAMSVNYWLKGDKDNSMIHLGYTAHIVQDLTVPYHAALTPLGNHTDYENWISEHESEYFIQSGGLYNVSSAYNYVEYNANQSIKYIDENYTTIAENMIPLAQRSTAGLVNLFFENIEKNITLEYTTKTDYGTAGVIVSVFGIGIILAGRFRF